MTDHVAHSLELNTAGHTAGRAGLLHLRLIGLMQVPNSVAGMAEDPEIVSADITKLLEVRLVDPWPV